MHTLISILKLSNETIAFLSKLSGISGYLSISFWLFAQIPQVIKNHTDKSVEGFSIGFLLCWFGGDLLNLISCLLNNAMMFQILLSCYYCSIDIILGLQYYYYKYMYHNPKSKWYHGPKRKHRHIHSPRTSLRDNLQTYGSIDLKLNSLNSINNDDNLNSNSNSNSNFDFNNINNKRKQSLISPHYKTSPKLHVKGIFKQKPNFISRVVKTAFISRISKVQGIPVIYKGIDNKKNKENNSIIYKIIYFLFTLNKFKMGKMLAWSCTMLYLISRIPQIFTNFKFKSTNGVSLKLICFALCGNFFYALSLLFCESSTIGGKISEEFWKSELSYFIGAIGTVIFDIFLFIQWYIYDYRKDYKIITKSGKLKIISPNININSIIDSNLIQNQITNNIKIHNNNNNYDTFNKQNSDPIEVSISIKSTLSPNHMKKINEFTPLSPMDFLLDDYMANQGIVGSFKSGHHKTKRNNNNNTNTNIHSTISKIKNDDELNMSMDEGD
jgi:uncharacterized protein with PQ loop repeat